MPRHRRPKIKKLATRQDARRLVAALRYRDIVTDTHGRLFDLGAAVRRDAALALVSVADTGEVDIGGALIAALDDTSPEVRRAAASALGARRDGRAAAVLAEVAMDWEEPSLAGAREAALEALVDLSGPESIAVVIRTVVDRHHDRALARRIISMMVDRGGPSTANVAGGIAGEVLHDGDFARAHRAAEVLVWLGADSVDLLIDRLREGGPGRLAAIGALGRLGDLRATGALTRVLGDDEPAVRRAAVVAMGEIADPGCVQALTLAMNDPDQGVRAAILEVLRRLGPAQSATSPEPREGLPFA